MPLVRHLRGVTADWHFQTVDPVEGQSRLDSLQ